MFKCSNIHKNPKYGKSLTTDKI